MATKAKKNFGNAEYSERIKASIAAYPPMPAMYRELMKHVNDPDVDFSVLADIVRYDPGVTMNVLKVVNSAAYSASEPIDSLQQAVVRLGSKRLFKIILAQGVAAKLATHLDGYGLEPRMLLKHSIAVALTAETLAVKLGRHPRETLFTAGLLHDMGKLVLDPFVKKKHNVFDRMLRETDLSFDEMERQLLGISHAEAGGRLMESWSFPKDLIGCVEGHHTPDGDGCSDPHETALMVHLADMLVYSIGIGDGIDGFRYHLAEDAAVRLGLRSRDVEHVASMTVGRMTEWDGLI